MELIKKNIHMDRIKCRSTTQVTLEEDLNIPENKPDVANLLYEKATIQIEEVKPTEDHVSIRGRLLFLRFIRRGRRGRSWSPWTGSFPLRSSSTWRESGERTPSAYTP